MSNGVLSFKVNNWYEIPGWFAFAKAYEEAVENAKDGDIFIEIGVFLGRSTAYLASLIKQSKKQITLYVIDTFEADTLDDEVIKQQIKQHCLCSNGSFIDLFWKYMTDLELTEFIKPLKSKSDDAFELLKHVKANFIWVDGCHEYEQVLTDIKNYSKLLKPETGVIGGDDYKLPGVNKAVNEFFESEKIKTDGLWPYWIVKSNN